MDLLELDDLFEDNDEEIIDHINNQRTYTVKERIDHVNILDDAEFFRRFRFSKNTARIILDEIIDILGETTVYHQIEPMNQLLITLRFYATGSFYVIQGDFIGIHKTTAGRIIKRVTEALITLAPRYIKFPDTQEERRSLRLDFLQIANFPRVCGAIDCTHIKINSQGGDNAEFYRNRKGYFSLNVQAVSNSQNYIMDLVARWPGSAHDSHIFENSNLIVRLQHGEFDDMFLLGDSGYPLRNYLMTPLANPVTRAQEAYNRSHIRTRQVIERTFGIWKRRFAILSIGMRCNITLVQEIIIATAILHNIAVLNREDNNIADQDNPLENVINEVETTVSNLSEKLIYAICIQRTVIHKSTYLFIYNIYVFSLDWQSRTIIFYDFSMH